MRALKRTGGGLDEAVARLSAVVSRGEEYLTEEELAPARELLVKVSERRSLSMDLTVIAVAGTTGSGKSSLVNAIVGRDVVAVSAKRPTTSVPHAVSAQPASEVLDWLGVHENSIVKDVPGGDSAVLVDLPDIDSTEESNAARANELIARADAVVWVLDPQKYADAVVHRDYLPGFSRHAGVLLVVLNQIDRVNDDERRAIVSDLGAILEREGVHARIFATSARTGEGISDLRRSLSGLVGEKEAARARLGADIGAVSAALRERMVREGGLPAPLPELPDFAPVAAAVAKAAGVGTVVASAQESWLRRGRAATSWPLVAWVHRVRVDPLARLHLRSAAGNEGVAPVVSLAPSPAHARAAYSACARYAEDACVGLPRSWRTATVEDASGQAGRLIGDSDDIFTRLDLGQDRRPGWWRLVQVLQLLGWAVMLGGLVWLDGMLVASWLALRLPDPPYYGVFPLPTLLLAGGLAWGWLLALLSGMAVRRGAARLGVRIHRVFSQDLERRARESFVAVIEHSRQSYEMNDEDLRRLVA
ncbi:dynamin family protein [Arcanobacterium haemolyticum]|nr:dynamin family protein [Arcanobacterium haemolyticum]